MKKSNLKKLSVTGMLCAVAYLLTFLFRFKVQFLTFDLKDAIIAVCSLLYGPLYGVASALAVAFLEFITVSDTGVYGLIMNVLSSGSFALICGVIYKFRRTLSGAVISLITAAVGTVGVMMIANTFITPYYMGATRGAVVALIPTLLLPFNACKTAVNGAAAMIIYKPFVSALRRLGIAESGQGGSVNKKTIIIAAAGIAVIAVAVTAVLLLLGGEIEWLKK